MQVCFQNKEINSEFLTLGIYIENGKINFLNSTKIDRFAFKIKKLIWNFLQEGLSLETGNEEVGVDGERRKRETLALSNKRARALSCS